MKGVERSLVGVETATKGATLQTGRLGNQFASLAGQIAGVHPIVGNLAQVMGNFAVGGVVTVGILGATAIFATFYDTLTKGAREAREANDKLVKSLNDRIFREGLGPGGDLRLETDAERNKLRGLQVRERTLRAFRGGDDKEVLELQRQIIESQKTLAAGEAMLDKARFAAGKGLVDVMIKGGTETSKVVAKVKELSFSLEELRKNADEFWGPLRRFNEAFALPSTVADMTPGPVDISDSVKIADDQAREINDGAAKHAQMIEDAIWGSASMMASSIVGALNVGGGGPGSQIGGTLGTGIGGLLGGALGGPLGGKAGTMLGGIVGGMFGSALGGLFDSNKKAVNSNTDALNNNTAALLLGAPAGFRAQYYNNRASDPRMLYRSMEEEARRQAARGGRTGFALQASGA